MKNKDASLYFFARSRIRQKTPGKHEISLKLPLETADIVIRKYME